MSTEKEPQGQYPSIAAAQAIVSLCKAQGISRIVISPGSRNAPLSIGFNRDSFFQTYIINDERCAAFFALGMAKTEQTPVALVCTSGSAVLNYHPAVAEAYYSKVPLVVISADRPLEWIGQGAGQTIRQQNVLANHCAYSAQLLEGDSRDALWYNAREINTAINACLREKAPVHLNVPFSEPLYGTTNIPYPSPTVIRETPLERIPANTSKLREVWNASRKKMIVVGAMAPWDKDNTFERNLRTLSMREDVVVLTETTSNISGERFISAIDRALIPIAADKLADFAPDLLICFGGMVVSKKLKSFLAMHSAHRTGEAGHPQVSGQSTLEGAGYPADRLLIRYPVCRCDAHPVRVAPGWVVSEEGDFPDTYLHLSEAIRTSPKTLSEILMNFAAQDNPAGKSSGFAEIWRQAAAHSKEQHETFIRPAPFSDLKVWDCINRYIPEGVHLEVSNSAPVRYCQLFDWRKGFTMGCNRGTSGIDGCTSTAVGVALADTKPVTLVSGETSFLYDSNALWNKYIPENFRIIVINNNGGGIFRIIEGPSSVDELEKCFEAPHGLDASHLAAMYGFDYLKATDHNSLDNALETFWKESRQPKILEVFTSGCRNEDILKKYWTCLKK